MNYHSCFSSRRCRGKIVRAKNKVYWKALKSDPFNGFYFQTKPRGGRASNIEKPLYPKEQSLEWKRALRYYHGIHFGGTYNKSKFARSIFLGIGDVYQFPLIPPFVTDKCKNTIIFKPCFKKYRS